MQPSNNQQEQEEAMDSPDNLTEQQTFRRKGIYLLPNLLTTGAMFSGFYAILSAMSGDFASSGIAIFVAMVFDGLDGRVARMTNTQSAFGVQYDSISDMVSFGVAPAVVIYAWALQGMGKLGWAAAFLYAACAALRLARFNVQVSSVDKRFFIGLASPAAAGLIASLVWAMADAEVGGLLQILAWIVAVVAGLLMVSNFRYSSFKEVDLRGKVPFFKILAVVLVLVVLSINPPAVLLAVGIVYALSAPAMLVKRKVTKSEEPIGENAEAEAMEVEKAEFESSETDSEKQ